MWNWHNLNRWPYIEKRLFSVISVKFLFDGIKWIFGRGHHYQKKVSALYRI